MKRNDKKHWEFTTGLKKAKGLHTRALCQKTEGSVEVNYDWW
jgi:hypothetical protein